LHRAFDGQTQSPPTQPDAGRQAASKAAEASANHATPPSLLR
jgi:hypothetical protein